MNHNSATTIVFGTHELDLFFLVGLQRVFLNDSWPGNIESDSCEHVPWGTKAVLWIYRCSMIETGLVQSQWFVSEQGVSAVAPAPAEPAQESKGE